VKQRSTMLQKDYSILFNLVLSTENVLCLNSQVEKNILRFLLQRRKKHTFYHTRKGPVVL